MIGYHDTPMKMTKNYIQRISNGDKDKEKPILTRIAGRMQNDEILCNIIWTFI
jgi:hypothetical protein